MYFGLGHTNIYIHPVHFYLNFIYLFETLLLYSLVVLLNPIVLKEYILCFYPSVSPVAILTLEIYQFFMRIPSILLLGVLPLSIKVMYMGCSLRISLVYFQKMFSYFIFISKTIYIFLNLYVQGFILLFDFVQVKTTVSSLFTFKFGVNYVDMFDSYQFYFC